MYNGAGIWRLPVPGASAMTISEKMANIYQTLDSTAFYPTFAVTNTMFGFRVLLCNGQFTDPWGKKRSIMLVWNGESWTTATQKHELTHIGQYEDSSVMWAYGTDGDSLYQLFWLPDPTLLKRLSTKALRGKEQLTIKDWIRVYCELHDNTGLGIPLKVPPVPESVPHGVSINGSLVSLGGNAGGVQEVWWELSPSEPTGGMAAPVNRYGILPCATQGKGIASFLDLQSYSPDFSIERIHLTCRPTTLFGA
jgi:hypothetical protein